MRVRIPEAFTLHGQRFIVTMDPALCAKTGNRGEARLGYSEIAIQPEIESEPQPQSRVEQAFIHELVHGILFHMESSLNDDEKWVNLFANLLHQALSTMEYGGKK
jgi:hypothetical protein